MATRIADRTPVPGNLAAQPDPGASNRQLSYLRDLLAKHQMEEPGRSQLEQRITNQELSNMEFGDRATDPQGITSKRASAGIDFLLARPKLAQEDRQGQGGDEPWAVVDAKTWEQMGQPSEKGEELWVLTDPESGLGSDLVVPRGSYALENKDQRINDIAFYSVWIRDDGSRWSVKRYSSDELVGLPRVQQYGILERIAADPLAAATRYGLEKKRCGICHRKLTRKESRERGIGPVCAEKHGW